jgi:hypothetical protein
VGARARRLSCFAAAASVAILPVALDGQTAAPPSMAMCKVQTAGTKVDIVRPAADEAPIDDLNWFARPVPNREGRTIVAYASHDLNYLYDLSSGRRTRIPDKSDAVATPDGLFMTVPSHYTDTATTNFYDLATLLGHLDAQTDGSKVEPLFAHRHEDLADVYYQSIGVLSRRADERGETVVYRMMFSGGRHPEPPGFRVVDYTVRLENGKASFAPSEPMRLCPQIVKDMATPFISKDGRHVVALDASTTPASLKIFEILSTDPAAGTTSCAMRVDFGFAAGKADFSYDGSRLTFHISKHAYLTVFVNGGISKPAITDVVVVDLVRDASGQIVGHGGLARVTTSVTEGVGNYFPAFLPDGRILYLANETPKNEDRAKRFTFTVVDPSREVRMANFFLDERQLRLAETIGELWRESCASTMEPFKPGEAAWAFMSLDAQQCRTLVGGWTGSEPSQRDLLSACDLHESRSGESQSSRR